MESDNKKKIFIFLVICCICFSCCSLIVGGILYYLNNGKKTDELEEQSSVSQLSSSSSSISQSSVSQSSTPSKSTSSNIWKCFDDILTPIRKNNSGDVECMSTNNKDCMWQITKNNCDSLITNNPSNIEPLTCGTEHMTAWGSTGYDNPQHWCSKGKTYLSN